MASTIVYRDPWCQNGCYSYWQAGGGGGAGASPIRTDVANNPWGGTNGSTSNSSGNGGEGLVSSVTGSEVYYGAGGGGGVDGGQIAPNTWAPGALGGLGGGGNGGYYSGSTWTQPTPGVANSGSGGGGGWWCCADNTKQSGGSGIVILSAPVPHGKASLYLNTSSGTINFSGNLSNVNEFGISSNSPNEMSINYAQVTDSLRVVKSGPSTLSINSWQNYQGDLVVNGGRLNLVGTGSTVALENLLVANGAALNITYSSGFNASGIVSLDGLVTSDYGQTYNDVTTLAGDTILTAGNNTYVTFNSAVNDANFNTNHIGVDSLTINGNLTAQSIGDANGAGELGIGSITVTGSSILSGNITTLFAI
jgi:autotransporter-associated beta strand protein